VDLAQNDTGSFYHELFFKILNPFHLDG
ncbi:uncharacterized protein METZ01_LOCUS496629, partial [marine metagenome]